MENKRVSPRVQPNREIVSQPNQSVSSPDPASRSVVRNRVERESNPVNLLSLERRGKLDSAVMSYLGKRGEVNPTVVGFSQEKVTANPTVTSPPKSTVMLQPITTAVGPRKAIGPTTTGFQRREYQPKPLMYRGRSLRESDVR